MSVNNYSPACIPRGGFFLIPSPRWFLRVQIDPIDERIRVLCAKAATAQGSELVTVLKQLRAALREHNDFVRKMAFRTLNHVAAKEESSNADIPPGSESSAKAVG